MNVIYAFYCKNNIAQETKKLRQNRREEEALFLFFFDNVACWLIIPWYIEVDISLWQYLHIALLYLLAKLSIIL